MQWHLFTSRCQYRHNCMCTLVPMQSLFHLITHFRWRRHGFSLKLIWHVVMVLCEPIFLRLNKINEYTELESVLFPQWHFVFLLLLLWDMIQKLIQKHYSLIFLFVYNKILLGYFFSSLTSSIISNVMSRYWPLRQPLLHLFEESLVKLVDRIVAGGDQVLNRVWEGLVFPRNTLEGLQTDTCGHVRKKIRENMHTLSKNEKSSQGLCPSTPATVSSLFGSLNQTCSKRLRAYGVYVWTSSFIWEGREYASGSTSMWCSAEN